MFIVGPYYLSFVVCPSVLDDLSPLVVVASPSSHPDLLRGEVHVDFSGSNVDDSFDSVEERSFKDDGWIVLVFSHVNDLKICMDKMVVYFDRDISYYTFDLSECLVCHLELNVCWL